MDGVGNINPIKIDVSAVKTSAVLELKKGIIVYHSFMAKDFLSLSLLTIAQHKNGDDDC